MFQILKQLLGRQSRRPAPFYDDLSKLLARAHADDGPERHALERIRRPYAFDPNFTALLLVQPKHARLKDDGRVCWLNAAPEGALSLQVADVVRIGEDGAAVWTSFPIPSDFPVDKVSYDWDGVFSLWSGRRYISGTLPQMIAATQESSGLFIDGATEAQIAQAFHAIPTTPEPTPPPRKTVEDCPPVDDPVLGSVAFEPRFRGYRATVQYGGRAVDTLLDTDEVTALPALLSAAQGLVQNLALVDARARAFAARELLALKNGTWTEEGEAPVSEAEFIARPVLISIVVEAHGGWRLGYDDDDLFWGHWIGVEFSVDGEPTGAELSG